MKDNAKILEFMMQQTKHIVEKTATRVISTLS